VTKKKKKPAVVWFRRREAKTGVCARLHEKGKGREKGGKGAPNKKLRNVCEQEEISSIPSLQTKRKKRKGKWKKCGMFAVKGGGVGEAGLIVAQKKKREFQGIGEGTPQKKNPASKGRRRKKLEKEC